MVRSLLLLIAVIARPAMGQAIVTRLGVDVGSVVEVDVDYKIGYACDDTTILRGRMLTRSGHNWFVVQGVAPGRTWCRVGTDATLPSYLFDVVVNARP